MNEDRGWEDDIFREKSLWDVYKASLVISPSAFNRRLLVAGYLIAASYVLANFATGVDNKEVVDAIQRLSSAILTISTAILGFLVTGFSIFVASTPKGTMKTLLGTRYKNTNISYFKQVMFNFINVFSIYLVSLAVSIATSTVTPLGISPFLWKFRFEIWSMAPMFNSIVMALMSILALSATLRLKSFIWNLYQALLITMEL